MKKALLSLSMVMALGFGVQADVTYELVFVGKTSTGIDANNNPGKGEIMTKNADGSYSCTVPEINVSVSGFKITSDDADVMAAAKAIGVASPGAWHTQMGAKPFSDGALNLDEDASPLELIDFVTEVTNTGHTPGEIQFAGGVTKAENVTFTFWPAQKLLKAVGTPTEWAEGENSYGICNSTNGWAKPTPALLFTHEGNGIYTLEEYDFDVEGAASFKIRKNNTKPIYGFAAEQDAFTPTLLSQRLVAYHVDSEKRREPGDASKAASVQVTIAKTVKADGLTGVYSIKFDANSQVLTLTPKDTKTGVENLQAEDGEIEYYNLQGVKVANPKNGIFICKKGDKVIKTSIK